MIVHPQYHHNTEPVIYGLAKYNLHYHEFVRVSSMVNYSFPLGNQAMVKSLCGEDLTAFSAVRVAALTETDVIFSSPFTETTEQTKLSVEGANLAHYTRFKTHRNDHKLSDTDSPGFIYPQALQEMLQKQQAITLTLDRPRPYYFFKDQSWLLDGFLIQADKAIAFQAFLDNTPIAESQKTAQHFHQPEVLKHFSPNNVLQFFLETDTKTNVAITVSYYNGF